MFFDQRSHTDSTSAPLSPNDLLRHVEPTLSRLERRLRAGATLRSERFYGIESGGADRWIESGEEADAYGEAAGHREAEKRDRQPGGEKTGDHFDQGDSAGQADGGADYRQRDRLDQELAEDLAIGGSHGLAQSDLEQALGY